VGEIETEVMKTEIERGQTDRQTYRHRQRHRHRDREKKGE